MNLVSDTTTAGTPQEFGTSEGGFSEYYHVKSGNCAYHRVSSKESVLESDILASNNVDLVLERLTFTSGSILSVEVSLNACRPSLAA